MAGLLEHRGPDDRGVWAGEGVGLGHTRLAILDPSPRGHQPFLTDDATGVLAYNGEIYNFRALRDELSRDGVAFRSETDTEVLLQALHVWGVEAAVARLNGMFAFAYYDRRDGCLWLARDRLGIKPLYVAGYGGGVAFASEMKALFAHPAVALEPDQHALFNLVLYERFDGGLTPYRGVRALPPGALLRIPAVGEPEQISYFDMLRDLDPQRLVAAERDAFASQVDRFEALLRASVGRHMVSDVPLATMCSGGLDSSLVTALAREHHSGLVSYVADVEGVDGEEVRRAGAVAAHLGVPLRVVDVSAEAFFETLPAALQAQDQPLFFSQGVAALLVARDLREDGHKVILTGDGADELFGGYGHHADAYRRWRRLRLRGRQFPLVGLGRLLSRLHSRFAPPDLARLARDPLYEPGGATARVPPLNAALLDGARRQRFEAGLFHRLSPLEREEDRAFLVSSFADLRVHLGEYLRTMDAMAMSQSVENRVPFLDAELVDFALHLPVSAKYAGGTAKRVVHALARKHLPSGVLDLPKIGFGIKPRLWRGTEGMLRGGRVAELLGWQPADEPGILALLRRQPYYQFRLTAMELWLRMTFDGDSPDELSRRLSSLRDGSGG